MTPYLEDSDVRLYQGDSLEVLRSMPDASVHMACTSPPFFGLRDYGTGTWEGGDEECDHKTGRGTRTITEATTGKNEEGNAYRNSGRYIEAGDPTGETCGKCGARRIDSQIGLESSPDEWATRLVDVFSEVRRVLRDDGTLWVECGDSYAGGVPGGSSPDGPRGGRENVKLARQSMGKSTNKPKDLIGQPWLLAFALRTDGWFLRSCIIWSKPNAMPESVTDRPTTGHSYVFLFSKRPRYFYDAEALREPHQDINHAVREDGTPERSAKDGSKPNTRPGQAWNGAQWKYDQVFYNPNGRNARTVWQIPTEPNALAICRICDAYWQGGAPREHCGEPVVQHFAAFPRELVRRMILAGTSERGVCGECGAPWVREVETTRRHIISEGGSHTDGTYHVKYADEEHAVGFRERGGDGVVRGMNEKRWHNVATTTGWGPSCKCVVCPSHGAPRAGLQACERCEQSLRSPSPIPATVLDPFSGSGTTLLVARSLGRHAVGVELSVPYCKMTRARLAQLSLLSELPA